MLENNNLLVCRRLVWRDFRFHKLKNILLMASISFICAVCTFSFAMGSLIQSCHNYDCEQGYGSHSNIQYYGLTNEEADRIAGHNTVKSTVRLSPVGILSGDEMEYRSVRLAAAAPDWAKNVEAFPTMGRMPEEDDEIALDELTMDSLGIPHEEGAKVIIRWKSMDGSREYTDTFRLCGWWKSIMNYTETCAWITPKAASRMEGGALDEVILGVDLHQPKDLEAQGIQILQDTGLNGQTFTTNLSYNEARVKYAGQLAMPYFMVNFFVVICGIFVIYNILHISVEQNKRFYERLKSLGMAPRQILYLPLFQCLVLCLFSIPVGWLLGVGMAVLAAPVIIVGMGGVKSLFSFFKVWPLIASALVTGFAVFGSCRLPVRAVAKMSPAELLSRTSPKNRGKKRWQKLKRGHRSGIFRMAVRGVLRQKGDIILSIASLFVALVLLCGTWTGYASIDENKYMDGNVAGDYLLADASAADRHQRYNPGGKSITPRMALLLREHPAVTEYSIIKTMEVPMKADEIQRAPIVETFEGRDETGAPRKEFMEGNADWMEGYERLKKTGDYIGIVTGIDGSAAEEALDTASANDGAYDAEKFYSGMYVVAAGSNSEGILTTPPAGSRITICGREFTILASVPAYLNHITGSNSRAAEFHVSYYLPMEVFDELFPDSGIRNAVFNIEDSRQKEFEEFLSGLLEGTNVHVISYDSFRQDFQASRISQVLVGLLVGCVLMMIGVINFANSLFTRMLVRKKEFAVYESLGMTKQELKQMILIEGLIQAAVITVVLLPSVSAAAWIWGRWWAKHTDIWCITYQFDLLPLWLAIPFLLILSVAVPFFSLKALIRESITDRLNSPD